MFVAVKPCKLGGEIPFAREDKIMAANHPGMSDQTSSNIARDGAAKKPQTNFATAHGHKNSTVMSGIAPGNPGVGPDAAPGNPLAATTKSKKSGPIPVKWGMKGTHDPALGSAVLAEAANLGR